MSYSFFIIAHEMELPHIHARVSGGFLEWCRSNIGACLVLALFRFCSILCQILWELYRSYGYAVSKDNSGRRKKETTQRWASDIYIYSKSNTVNSSK